MQALLDTVVDEGFKDFNETVLYGRDTDVDEVLAAARRFPMMADRQLVLVKEAQDMRMWKRKDDMAKLAAYAEDPVPTTVLVFAHPHKKVDSRLKAVKTMSRQGTLFLSDKVRDHKLPQWIAGYAEAKGLKLDGRVSQLLAESLGNNLQKVANELSKLQILLPEGTKVTTDHVEQHIGISKDYNVFELNALGNKDVERANRIVVLRGQPQERTPCDGCSGPACLLRARACVPDVAGPFGRGCGQGHAMQSLRRARLRPCRIRVQPGQGGTDFWLPA